MTRATAMPFSAVVVGMGNSGCSAVRYLLAHGNRVAVTDSRADPPNYEPLAAMGDRITLRVGGFDTALLEHADVIVTSPGVATNGPFFDRARALGLPLVGDVELFARAARAPVAGITGTNGKSTVTTLLAQMAQRSGLRTAAGGNLGAPALDLLHDSVQLYVLELSSFQLETIETLAFKTATVLNVTPDHLDRYADGATYAAAKARIFRQCDVAVINLDDPVVVAMIGRAQKRLSFSVRSDTGADFALRRSDDSDWWLTRSGAPLLALSQMKINGLHNAANALAALALAEALGLPRAVCLQTLRDFEGLPHRAQWVADSHGVRYINDSKGTNVGATLAAVAGMNGPLIVIAGGDGKGQDFTPLRDAFAGKVRATVLIGRAAGTLETLFQGSTPSYRAPTLEEAVEIAAQLARPGDTVLLSPACASLDMFRDYAHRGSVFAAAVRRRST